MEIDSRTLKILCAVVDAGSLQAAAGRVHLSASAISRIISQFEKDLGIPLFDRRDRRLFPTPAGQAFHLRARETLLLMDDLTAFGRKQAPAVPPPLRVAAFSRHAETIVAPAMAQMMQTHGQGLNIVLDMHAQRDFGFSKLARPFDVGFGNLATHQEDLSVLTLARSGLVVAVPPSHQFFNRTSLAASDLASEPMICLSRDTIIATVVNKALGGTGSLTIAAEVSHTYIALRMTREGLGLHVTDRLAALDAAKAGLALVPLRDGPDVAFVAFWPNQRGAPWERTRQAIVAVAETLKANDTPLDAEATAFLTKERP